MGWRLTPQKKSSSISYYFPKLINKKRKQQRKENISQHEISISLCLITTLRTFNKVWLAGIDQTPYQTISCEEQFIKYSHIAVGVRVKYKKKKKICITNTLIYFSSVCVSVCICLALAPKYGAALWPRYVQHGR